MRQSSFFSEKKAQYQEQFMGWNESNGISGRKEQFFMIGSERGNHSKDKQREDNMGKNMKMIGNMKNKKRDRL